MLYYANSSQQRAPAEIMPQEKQSTMAKPPSPAAAIIPTTNDVARGEKELQARRDLGAARQRQFRLRQSEESHIKEKERTRLRMRN